MRFLCLAYEEERKLNELSQTEWHALREETLEYVDTLQRSGRLILTLPLQSATMASTLRVRDGDSIVTVGPFAETREQIGGFFLIEAADLHEALRIASEWPSARFGTIEVRPIEDGLHLDRRYGGSEAG
jgi:hypothetical protein